MTRRNPKNRQTEKSPIQLRREFLGLSQKELGAVADVSTISVQRTEYGLMPNVPFKLFTALYGTDRDTELTNKVHESMEEWKDETRRANVRYLQRAVAESQYWSGWLGFREYISESKAGFCKLYCIHPQALDNFEKPHLVEGRRELSPYLERIFYTAGLTRMELDTLNSRLYWHVSTG